MQKARLRRRVPRARTVLRCAAAAVTAALSMAPAVGAAGAMATMEQAADPAGQAASPRVITLTPHATEIVYAAAGGDLMVGTVSSSDFPEAARGLPRIGDGMVLNQERIIVLRPTLIIGWHRSGIAPQVEALSGKIGAQMLYSAPARLRDIPADVRKTGRLMGTEAAASKAAAAMEARIQELEDRHAGRRPVTVFIEVGHLPLYTIGADPLLNDALRICGGVNIYGASGVPAPRVPIENVLVQDPQLLVAPARSPDELEPVRARWTDYGLDAAIKGRVHAADPDALFRPGPRLIDATEALCGAIEKARKEINQRSAQERLDPP